MDAARDILDRTVTSYTGGINTAEYYAKIYANEQNGVPTETLVIQGSQPTPLPTQRATQTPPQSGYQTQYTSQSYTVSGQQAGPSPVPQGGNESAIDYFLRTSAAGSPTTPQPTTYVSGQPSAPASVPATQGTSTTVGTTYTTSVGATPAVSVSPTGVFGFLVQAAFSVAVVVSVIGVMFIVYIIIRTRQLHHHEHHVKELGGHAVGHGGGHAPATTHEVHVDAHSSLAAHDTVPEEDASHHREEHHEEPFVENGVETHVYDAPHAPHDTILAVHEDDIIETSDMPPVTGDDMSPPRKPTEVMTDEESTLFASRLATVRADAASDDEDAWYTALMDVNLLLEDILTEKNFEGATVKEMLMSDAGQGMATRDLALEAEAQFQKLISGEEPLTQDAIVHLVNMYAKVCKELGVV